jgi:hypothetical protein
MEKTRSRIAIELLAIAGLTASLLFGADAAGAAISVNTIDRHATYSQDGAKVRSTGPIGCTRGERVTIRVTVTQASTGARARRTWKRRCTGELQHWQVRARARHGTRFEAATGRVCAAAKTRNADRVTDTRTWCERVSVSARF